MIIDVNAYTGHYPFRHTKYKTAAELIGLMDRYGIEKSCVASLNAVFYKDNMVGNYELLDEIAPYKDRLIPFCVINPEYNGALEDFTLCIKKLGFKGLRMFPRQQCYKLDGELSTALMRMAAEAGIPVHIPLLMEDLRGHHPLDPPKATSADEIKRAALAVPEADIILSNEYLQYYAKVIEPACAERSGKIYYDICRVDCVYLTSMKELLDVTGYDRLVFGTGAMLQTISVQLVKLHFMGETIGAAKEQTESVSGGNLARLLKI